MLYAWTGLLFVSYNSLRIVRISEWISSCKLYIVSWSFTRFPRIAIKARGVYPWRKLRRYGSMLGGNVVFTYDSVWLWHFSLSFKFASGRTDNQLHFWCRRRTRFVLLQPMIIIAASCGGGLFTRPSPYCDSVCRQEEAINSRIWLRWLYLANRDVLRLLWWNWTCQLVGTTCFSVWSLGFRLPAKI